MLRARKTQLPEIVLSKMQSLNSVTTLKEIDTTFKNIPTMKTLGSDGFTQKFSQTLKEEIICLFQFLPGNIKRRNMPPSHFTE